jgi:thioredoxin 2
MKKMMEKELVIRCLRCGQKNRIRQDRVGDTPLCGRCNAHLDELILRCLACGTRNIVREDRLHDRPICGKCGVPLYQGYADDISDDTFVEEVISFPGPVLMCCWAPGCSSTRAMIPVLNKLGRKYAGGVKIGKLNIYENPRIAERYAITATPTFLFYREGTVIKRLEGEQQQDVIENILRDIVANRNS